MGHQRVELLAVPLGREEVIQAIGLELDGVVDEAILVVAGGRQAVTCDVRMAICPLLG